MFQFLFVPQQSLFRSLLFTLGILLAVIKLPVAQAQVTSDNTTGTQVNNNGNVAEITGGETRGDNLFHSFQDFSVPTGGAAFFNNADNIGNIFSRVTGGNISNIDGLISANGSANLFLINPAGIMFGENGGVNLGGSFYGSTADSIIFEEGEFSAADLDNPPLLTVNAPIGFSFRDNPGDITSNGAFLGVNANETLALLGGNLSFDGGFLVAAGGQVELGSLTQQGTIDLNGNGGLSFPESVARDDISFNNGSIIFVSGNDNGSININAKNLSLASTSSFFAGIATGLGSTDAQAGDVVIDLTGDLALDDSQINNTNLGTGNTGNILINADNLFFTNGGAVINSNTGVGNIGIGNIEVVATGDISFDGTGTFAIGGIQNNLGEEATGNAGQISLSAQNLNLTNGAVISSFFQNNNSSDITVNITDTILIEGTDTVTRGDDVLGELSSTIGSGVSDGNGNSGNVNINAQNLLLNNLGTINGVNTGSGNSGNVNINVDTLSITEGGSINGGVVGDGDGGNININAEENVSIIGNTEFQSFISADISSNATGEAGNIAINTPQLILQAASISADVQGNGEGGTIDISATDSIELSSLSLIEADVFAGATGNGGNVNIETGELTLSDGSTISALTLGSGNAGNVTIIADESTDLSGVGEISRGGILASALIENGNGGNIDLTTGQLTISDGAIISASNFSSLGTVAPGTGEPGNIAITAGTINLESEGRIEATTQATTGTGANIDLQVADTISLTGNSFISAEALGNANGGNLSIDTNFIVAFPEGNNDLIASADQGQGGNIDIVAESLLGIEERPLNPFTNDINASSEFGLDGSISIDVPDVNPLQGATELSVGVIATEEVTAQVCSASRDLTAKNGLSINGKGGVPPAPDLPLNSTDVIVNGEIDSTAALPQPLKTAHGNIQPARGIKITESGKVTLVAYRTNSKGDRPTATSSSCGLREKLPN